jgi:hypothetical protein
MVYAVIFDPTDADYKILKKRGIAFGCGVYPIVSRSGFRSPQEAEDYIDSNWNPAVGQSREVYSVIPGSYPNPDQTGWRPTRVSRNATSFTYSTDGSEV